jgi:hypothetical protein
MKKKILMIGIIACMLLLMTSAKEMIKKDITEYFKDYGIYVVYKNNIITTIEKKDIQYAQTFYRISYFLEALNYYVKDNPIKIAEVIYIVPTREIVFNSDWISSYLSTKDRDEKSMLLINHLKILEIAKVVGENE